MKSFERMLFQLKPLRLYQMNGNSLVEAELQAYGAVFDKLYEEIHAQLKEVFLDEVDAVYGEKFERLFMMPKTRRPLTEETRKERIEKIGMMKERLKIKNCDFGIQRVKDAIATGGMKVEFEEDFRNQLITVAVIEDKNLFSAEEEKIDFIKRLMPCHSRVEVVFLTGKN